ncbi:pilus assembly protein [Escherichia coli]|uniref:toxin co-regulated pilus biosynthesis Q family protein n=1 Tax=Escherichia coli TaxID=562 RepID=UPI0019A549AB|nr:TcpQ domain-containing protein [Escherichia coli]EET6339199.1 pilus assembly protein [Escherichia coli]EHH4809277.1 pilus assembly protein [Escherichia coli]EHN2680132.1 TcpQ domain-containing protein [Escherichia coli]EHN6428206.1 TcpQ domain-containing protein [Escherichia coli]EHO1310132.1 TcpQ domain-containing protein [Escherichia coli]
MQKKSLTLLLPSLLSGCTAFNATPVPDTTPPALVFVDGQIRESAAIIAHTQKRLLPPPVTRPVTPPRPTTTATPTTAVSSQSNALPPRPLLQATQLPALVMTGKPGQSSVVYLREARQRSVSDWIRQLLPPGWQFRQQNAAIPALNKRLPVWSVNDQWHRALNTLLTGQQLYGHMDWNRKILTVTTTAAPPVDLTAPQGSQKTADTPRNPFRSTTGTAADQAQVPPAVSASRVQSTTGTSGTSAPRTTTPAPVVTKPVAPSPQKVTPPRQWKMEKGTTLKDGLARWTSSEKCPHGTWTLRWETPVNYSIDAPLVFTGSFRQALEQLFALYTPVEKPLYARTSTAQCLLRVTDRPQE